MNIWGWIDGLLVLVGKQEGGWKEYGGAIFCNEAMLNVVC